MKGYNNSQILIYQSQNGVTKIDVTFMDETVWLSQQQMAELFQTSRTNVVEHIKHIYEEGELDEQSTCRKFRQVQKEGNREVSRELPFYATIQNKFHYAITNRTAAEIVYDSADHTKEHMGLTTWKNSPSGRILKSDVAVAKNYLTEKQIKQLERTVTGYFDYIEDLIERENVFTMEEFEESVNAFLEFRQYKILKDNGRIYHRQATDKAYAEYEVFNRTQPIESDFDKAVKKILTWK